MNNNFNNQPQMGADFARTQLASNVNKIAKIILITAIIIIVAHILNIVFGIVNAQVTNEITELRSKKTLTESEGDLLRTKSLSLIPYTLIMGTLVIAELVFIIITWVKQSKLNKELVLSGLKKYTIYPAVLVFTFVIAFIISRLVVVSGNSSLSIIMSNVFNVIYIIIAVLMLKQSQQMKKDFNQNA